MDLDDYKPTLLHAGDNYLATLKYLWTFTRKLVPKVDAINTDNEILDAIDAANDKAVVGVPHTNTTKFTRLQNFIKYTLINYYDGGIAYESTHTQKLRCKYIMYGMITHLLGDLYAHRVIVPKTAVYALNGTETYKASKKDIFFDPKDFLEPESDSTLYDEFEGLSKLISLINGEKIGFSEIKEYYSYSDSDACNKIAREILNPKYVDNGQFYDERIFEAYFTISFFISCYSDNYFREIVIPATDLKIRKYSVYSNEIVDAENGIL